MARNQQRAFTKVELLVVLALVGVLALLVLGLGLRSLKGKAGRINCVNNVKNIGLAMRIFATDHQDLFPMQASTNEGGVKEFMDDGKNLFRIFQSLSNELSTTKILACTLEPQIRATNFQSLQNSNVSYFAGLDATEDYPQRILGGDRNLRTAVSNIHSGILYATTNDFVGWTQDLHQFAGNLILVDGSVVQARTKQLQTMLSQSGLATNRFMLRE